MLRMRISRFTIVTSWVLLMNSCTKPGLGGGNVIIAYPQHHEKPIFGDTIYVKFNALELPGTKPSDYDIRFIGNPNEDHCYINGLTPGNYYLYAVAWDPAVNERVVGGLGVKLEDKQGETKITIAVTE